MSSDAAFPYRYQEIPGDPVHHYHGLTKREYFAGLAMQALLQVYEEDCARKAVEVADALLNALNEPREP